MALDLDHDRRIRGAAFDWLREQVAGGHEVLSYSTLADGFEFRGDRVSLVGRGGIFIPTGTPFPLSIRSAQGGRYRNEIGSDGLLRYRYRAGDPEHPDNVGMRTAMENFVPLVYFHGLERDRYKVVWPVYVVGDSAEEGAFSVTVRG